MTLAEARPVVILRQLSDEAPITSGEAAKLFSVGQAALIEAIKHHRCAGTQRAGGVWETTKGGVEARVERRNGESKPVPIRPEAVETVEAERPGVPPQIAALEAELHTVAESIASLSGKLEMMRVRQAELEEGLAAWRDAKEKIARLLAG